MMAGAIGQTRMTIQLKLPRAVLSEINKLAHQTALHAEVRIRKQMVEAALEAIAEGIDWRSALDQKSR